MLEGLEGEAKDEEGDEHEEEALDLHDAPAHPVHEVHGDVVARKADAGDDEHLDCAVGVHVALDGRGTAGLVGGKDLLEHARLEELVAVEGDVEEQPTARSTDELAPILAHAERLHQRRLRLR